MEELTLEIAEALESSIRLEFDATNPRRADVYVEGTKVETTTVSPSFWTDGTLSLGEELRAALIPTSKGLPPRTVQLSDVQVGRYLAFKEEVEAERAYRYGTQCANEIYGDETIRDRILKGGDLSVLADQMDAFVEGVSDALGTPEEEIRPEVEEAFNMLQQSE